MPRIKATLPGSGVPWTKVPNALLDRLMPGLRDTELRVLLALLRGTAGWNREGRAITLSYRVLRLRTGRHNEAVARALASLREKGLVHIPAQLRAPLSGAPRAGKRRATDKDKDG